MYPKVNPCWPSADTPPRTGVHSVLDVRLSAFARSASTTAAFPFANWPGGIGITTSSANIAESPETRSVFALAAENARSAASNSSTTDCGETPASKARAPAEATARNVRTNRVQCVMTLLCRERPTGYNRDTRPVGNRQLQDGRQRLTATACKS